MPFVKAIIMATKNNVCLQNCEYSREGVQNSIMDVEIQN